MLDSSVWQLSKEARILWVTILLKQDRDHVVRAAVPGLAHAARLTVAETEAALKELSRPDKYSQSPEEEGRRIVAMAGGGWLIVNGAKYRDRLSEDERREYKAAKQAEYRKRKKSVLNGASCEGAQQAIKEGLAEANSEVNAASVQRAEGESEKDEVFLPPGEQEPSEPTFNITGGQR